MTTSKNQEAENSFWEAYSEEIIEEVNFRLIIDFLNSKYPLFNKILMIQSIEFKGIQQIKKKKVWERIYDSIKRFFKKKGKKE